MLLTLRLPNANERNGSETDFKEIPINSFQSMALGHHRFESEKNFYFEQSLEEL